MGLENQPYDQKKTAIFLTPFFVLILAFLVYMDEIPFVLMMSAGYIYFLFTVFRNKKV